MSSLVLTGDTSGQVTISAPAVAGTSTLTLQAGTATNSMNTLATAVASTSGTSINFTSLPAWIKKITVMFSGVSLSGTANFLLQIGTGGTPTTSGYSCVSMAVATAGAPAVSSTAGFIFYAGNPPLVYSGIMTITNITSNTWVANGNLSPASGATQNTIGAGTGAISGVLDNLRITTTNGTDTFDAGSVNILYEG